MTEESLHGEYRLFSLDHYRGKHRNAVRWLDTTSTRLQAVTRLLGTVWGSSVGPFDRVEQHGSPLWASPDVPLTRRAPWRAEARHFAPLTAIQRLAAAIGERRWRVRSHQELWGAQRAPAQGHRPHARGARLRSHEAVLALRLSQPLPNWPNGLSPILPLRNHRHHADGIR
jgi:hypothetical protein